MYMCYCLIRLIRLLRNPVKRYCFLVNYNDMFYPFQIILQYDVFIYFYVGNRLLRKRDVFHW